MIFFLFVYMVVLRFKNSLDTQEPIAQFKFVSFLCFNLSINIIFYFLRKPIHKLNISVINVGELTSIITFHIRFYNNICNINIYYNL